MSVGAGPVVVGVQPDQASAVIETAVRLAGAMHRPLVFVEADVRDAYIGATAGIGAYGMADVAARSQASDDAEQLAEDRTLRSRIADAIDGSEVDWTFARHRGEPFEVLTRAADEVDAALIVVGTREAGFSHALLEFFTGSVATRLAHGQRRPVVVVPLGPTGLADRQSEPPADGEVQRR